MTTLSDKDSYLTMVELHKAKGNVSVAANNLEIPRTTVQNRRNTFQSIGLLGNDSRLTKLGKSHVGYYKLHKRFPEEDEILSEDEVEFPDLPSDKMDTEDLWDHLIDRSESRIKADEARKWMEFKVKIDGPFGLAFVGDPHVDDNGCNYKLLARDLEILQETKAMWGVGLGDWTNAWIGSLRYKYMSQEATRPQGWQLAEDVVTRKKNGTDDSIWWILIKGNHDLWADADDPLDWMQRGNALLEDWEAKFQIKCKNGKQFKIWASHDFPGTSIYNPNHGGMRKAMFTGAQADLYICGHRHEWALFQTEDTEHNHSYWVGRARGYKFVDSYAKRLGFGSQTKGATICAVFDPDSGSVTCLADLQEAQDFLKWKRKRLSLPT